MGVPPGMGPEEYRAHCFAQADPEWLKAIEERTLAKWSKLPGAVDGPPRREWNPPRSPSLSDSIDGPIGLLSPSASEHGKPVNPQKKSAAVADESSNAGASVSSDSFTEELSRPSKTPKSSGKTSSGTESRMSKVERRSRKINTRIARSKASSVTTLSQVDDNDCLNVEPGSIAAVADSSGKNLSSSLEPSPSISTPQVSTENASSKPAARDKRKRDQDDVPTRKRVRIEPPNAISSAVSGPAEVTDKDSDNIHTLPSRIENWLQGQESVHEPARSTSIESNEGRYTWLPLNKAQKLLLQEGKSGKIPKGKGLFSGPGLSKSVQKAIANLDRKDKRARHSLSDRVPNRIVKRSPRPTRQSPVTTVIEKLKKVHHQKVENLLDAFQATSDYCEALELKEEFTHRANLYLYEVFHHPFPEYHPTHALIVACIYVVYGGNELRAKWGNELDQFIWPPDICPTKCGPAIAAVNQFFLSRDSKRMRPKATRRGPETYPKSPRPSY